MISEFRLAMIHADLFYKGTSIAEGAFKMLDEIYRRQRELEQELENRKAKP